MRPFLALFSEPVSGHLASWADFITTTSEFRFSTRTDTQMNVVIQKLNGLWHLIVGSCRIRTPFLETQDREFVVSYARRAYPGAKIFER